ncbi:hypothetical protein ACFPWP_04195 [Kribbella jiaozuonensis]
MTGWVQTWGPLITLASTVLLAAITAWLAWLTKVMADAARTAAKHSQTAAEASQASVAATEAAINIDFAVTPNLVFLGSALKELLDKAEASGLKAKDPITSDFLQPLMELDGVKVECMESTVYIHGCRIDAIGKPVEDSKTMTITTSCEIDLESREEKLPHQLHRGENIDFKFESKPEPPGTRIKEIRATIFYGFTSGGEVRERSASWHEESWNGRSRGKKTPSRKGGKESSSR